MSKRSRERKRLLREAAEAKKKAGDWNAAPVNNQPTQGQLPIIGSFEQRATEIIKRDNEMNGHGNRTVYEGYPGGHFISNGPVDTGYRPINHEKDQKIFNIKSTDITEGTCPIAKVPKVYVSTRLWNEWICLAEDYSTEWLAYLTGQFVKDDKGSRYEVQKMYFPPQVAHATHVDVDDDFEDYLPNTIGAIHSHVQMGVFFSGEDLSHSNWPIEIVVNAKGEAKVMIRHQLECGNWIKNYSEVLTVGDSAGEKYIASLDKAFERGEQLRQQRVNKKSESVGYRTPKINRVHQDQPVASPPVATFESDKDWKFRINGVPHRWRQTGPLRDDGKWIKVVKVGDNWVDFDDPVLGSSQIAMVDKVDSVPDATGDATDAIGEIHIDEQTGAITVVGEHDDGSNITETRPATQDEIDRMMEAEVDDASCPECGGTGKLDNMVNDVKVGVVECGACGGLGWKPEFYQGMGYEC